MSGKALNRREFMKVGAASVLGGSITLRALGQVDTSHLDPALPAGALEQLENTSLVPVTVQAVQCDQPNNIPVVQLVDPEGHTLHIYVGIAEGNAIRMALEQQTSPRPMTHDLMRSMLEAGGLQVAYAVITKLEQTTFYGMLVLEVAGQRKAVDCRPSDAMALCLRTGAPLYANRDLLSS